MNPMGELFKTYKIIFESVESFDRALALNPECVDIGYSDKVIAFNNIESALEFEYKLRRCK